MHASPRIQTSSSGLTTAFQRSIRTWSSCAWASVVRGTFQRADPRRLGAPGLVAGDVAVPQVEVGGEEAGHVSSIVPGAAQAFSCVQ